MPFNMIYMFFLIKPPSCTARLFRALAAFGRRCEHIDQ